MKTPAPRSRPSLAPLLVLALIGGCADKRHPGATSGPPKATPDLVQAPGSPLPIAATCVAVSDVNHDGHQDLILTVGTRLQTHFGDGSGKFRVAPDRQLDTRERATEIALADLDGDGRLDVVTADHDRYSISLFLGDGEGGFKLVPASPFWPKRGDYPHTHGLLLVDLNHDGRPDVVTANNADDDLAIMLNDANGGFTSPAKAVLPCGPSPYPLAAVDINGDGHLDLLVPNSTPGLGTVTILLGDGRGAFTPSPFSPIRCAGDVYFVATGDLNGDGHPDAILCGNHDDLATILLNDGKGKLTASPASPLRMGNRGWYLRIVDFDRDGVPDLLAVTETSVRAFSGNGHGGFQPAPFIVTPSGGKGCWKLAAGDLNEDGTLDVVTPNVESHDLTILLSKAR